MKTAKITGEADNTKFKKKKKATAVTLTYCPLSGGKRLKQ